MALELDALELVFQDDIDRARDRVRSVDRRTSDRKHLDMIDQDRRDGVEIDLLTCGRAAKGAGRGGCIARDEAAAVDEHKRSLRAEAVEVDELLADGRTRLLAAIVGSRDAERRQLVQRIGGVDEAAIGQRGCRDHLRGLERVETSAGQPRAGDDNLLGRSS